MKVLNEQNIGVQQGADLNGSDRKGHIKSFNELTPGDKFKAMVTDIQQGRVTIRLDSGQTLTAKSLVLPEARIGEESIFLVKENFKGQILLEMIKPDNNTLKSGLIKEALAGAGQLATPENMELINALMEKQLPIDGETIQKALFFKYTQGEALSLDKVLFLLEENLPVDKLSVELLNNIMEKHAGLKENLSSLTYEILDMPNAELKGQLLKQIAEGMQGYDDEKIGLIISELEAEGPGRREEALKEIIGMSKESLYFSLDENKTVEDFRTYFNKIYETIKNMGETIANMPAEQNEAVLQRLAVIQGNLEFMDHIGQYREYMQFPFVFADRENEGELVVFKNPGKRINYNEQASILIGLDCAYLGRVEVFITKLKNNLNMQFRLEKDETVKSMNRSFHRLAAALNEKGYLISGSSFKKLAQPFKLTDRIDIEDKGGKKAAAPRRYSFDMRV